MRDKIALSSDRRIMLTVLSMSLGWVFIYLDRVLIFPLLPALGLDSEMGKVWAIMSLGVGSMTISHANDSYFWIVSQMSEMDVKTAYKTHTVGTFFQGALGFFLVLIGYLIWSSFK